MDDRSNTDREVDERARTRVLPRSRSGGPTGPLGSRNVNFRTSVRGYDRREVDRYVERVNREIAELQIASSPESAVKHALDRVGEQTSAILQRARVSADEIVEAASAEAEQALERAGAAAREIVAEARAEADDIRSQASREAGELIAEGERELASAREQAEEVRARAEREATAVQTHIDTISQERRDLVEQVRELAARLDAVADFGAAADTRHAAPEPPGEAFEDAGGQAGADDEADGPAGTGGRAKGNARAPATRSAEPAGIEVWADQEAGA